jgi:beta-lactamase class D
MKFFFLITLLVISSCASKKETPEKEVCFMLFNLHENRFEEVENKKQCESRLPAASTFKVPLSVMAFDAGLLKSETEPLFKWNGKYNSITGWNGDQTPKSWMKESVVWVSQEITPKLGMDKMIDYLTNFSYGNEDMTGGLTTAWLTPTPSNQTFQNSLKISGYEQISFWKKLWHGELKVKSEAQLMTIKLLPEGRSKNGSVMMGKTGSGFVNADFTRRVGWYVAFLEVKKSDYIVLTNFIDLKDQPAGVYGGREAKEMTMKFLEKRGLW